MLRKRDLSASSIIGQTPKAQRSEILERFSKGRLDVLCAIGCLDEGIDIPEAEVAIIAAATNSKRQRVQRIGRVVRKHHDKEIASIYSIYATDSERDILVQEASGITEVAQVTWLKMGAM